ncbi:MAG: carbohydrate kinase family protein [Promethearchaeota archaeon]|nr:MAG: carbohydrate kinase family protein [Candidatus Lokiarchaeota archaeon]
MKDLDVICIGAALVDMVAKVERHPLNDDEVFVSDLKLLSGGAAANTAYACAKLGLKTAFIGKLGPHDGFSDKIINDFKDVSLDTSLIKYSSEYGTGSAYVALNPQGDRRIYAHSGAANYLSKEDIVFEEVTRAKIIFLSSLKNLEPLIEAAEIARKSDIPVILNPGMLIIDQELDNIKQLLERIDILIMSQREYISLLNIQDPELNEKIILESSNILSKLGIKVIIITMGSKGAFLMNRKESAIISASKIEDVIDTTGAGDAFSAGFIFKIVQDLNYDFEQLKINVEFGNFIAGRCIQKLGARNGIPTNKELVGFLD